MPHTWTIKSNSEIPRILLASCLNDSLIARLLVNRGVKTKGQAKYYLNPLNLDETSSLEIPEMLQAFSRIKEAIIQKQKILIFGDYDVDGTTSVALLYRAFALIGVEVDYYVPNRHSEGYGLNKDAITKFKNEMSIDLMITCDCGISNYAEVEYASTLALDVIITDHHAIPPLPPPSVANCNPKTLPSDHSLHHLPGVGVAYKLAELLIFDHFKLVEAKHHTRSLLDLVALGVIADLAPLRAENRILALKGLQVLNKTNKVGLQELLEISGSKDKASTEGVGFGIAPRINAAGRLSDAMKAVRLMITEDRSEAQDLVRNLNEENKARQELCQEITDDALMKLDEIYPTKNQKLQLVDNCIVLSSPAWHHGVIGIVASRLLEKYNVPVFMMAEEGNITKGSVRCIDVPGLDIYEEMKIIQKKTSLFKKFGGHKMAAGFSCDLASTQALIAEIKAHFTHRLAKENITKEIKIDAALRLSEINMNFFTRIEKLSPFGIDHPQPIFVSGPLIVQKLKTLGSEGKHLKLFLKEPNTEARIFEAVLWGRAEEFLQDYGSKTQALVTFAYRIKLNEYFGEQTLQLEIKDWNEPSEVSEEIFARFKNKQDHVLA